MPRNYQSPRQQKNDLLKHCKELVIPTIYHQWYNDLPTTSVAVDYVPEPAFDETFLEAMTDEVDEEDSCYWCKYI